MKKVLLYSVLLVIGLLLSQFLPTFLHENALKGLDLALSVLTMICLAYIMIQVGREFDIDKTRIGSYGADYIAAATAAAFPWIFCALYFIFLVLPDDAWRSLNSWKEVLIISRFAAPTSAGVLFSMLAAAGLSATWTYKKVRILAIFDDLDTVLLMIPLKILIVGFAWQMGGIIFAMAAFLTMAWVFLHRTRWPFSWKWILFYSIIIVTASEIIYHLSKIFDSDVPIHIEVLLPAFVLGCMLPAHKTAEETDHAAVEEKVSHVISSLFMVLVGLSMPSILFGMSTGMSIGWGILLFHVLMITLISNLGKMFVALFYRKEASIYERLAIAVGMFPRGEVGAGILVLALSYSIDKTLVYISMMSLALNLILTGAFIVAVKFLIDKSKKSTKLHGRQTKIGIE